MTTFISYSRANSEFATRFARDLKNAGFGIWLDQLDIPKGSRWDDEIERALDSSSTFIIILSPEAIESQNVKDELGYAIDHGKKILPVLLQTCKIPFRLRRFQFVDFTNRPYQDGLAEIQNLLVNTKQLATAKPSGKKLPAAQMGAHTLGEKGSVAMKQIIMIQSTRRIVIRMQRETVVTLPLWAAIKAG